MFCFKRLLLFPSIDTNKILVILKYLNIESELNNTAACNGRTGSGCVGALDRLTLFTAFYIVI